MKMVSRDLVRGLSDEHKAMLLYIANTGHPDDFYSLETVCAFKADHLRAKLAEGRKLVKKENLPSYESLCNIMGA